MTWSENGNNIQLRNSHKGLKVRRKEKEKKKEDHTIIDIYRIQNFKKEGVIITV